MKTLSLLLFSVLFSQEIPITTNSVEAKSLYKKAWELENRLETKAAETFYEKAIELDSSFALAHLRLAMISGDFTKRRKKVAEAMHLKDAVSEAEKLWILARNEFYGTGKGENEYVYFKQLYELYPNDAEANYLFAFVHVHHGKNNPQEAIRYFSRAIEINPEYLKPYNDLIYAYMDSREFEKGKKVAELYITKLAKRTEPLDSYADLLMRSGNYKESIEAYAKILKIEPRSFWAISGTAANLNFLGEHKKARNFLKKIDERILDDYQYRHRWRAELVSHLDEEDYNSALNTLDKQYQEAFSGRNKRESSFHLYYPLLRRVRIFYESGNYEDGFKAYERWNNYVQNSTLRADTKKRIAGLKNFYLAYGNFLQKNWTQAAKQLASYAEKSDEIKVLEARVFLAQKHWSKAQILLESTDLTSAYNQFFYALSLNGSGNLAEAKKWLEKIANRNEQNNIDLALVRKRAMNELNQL